MTSVTAIPQVVLEGNIHKVIPQSTYESQISPSRSKLATASTVKFEPFVHLQYYASQQGKDNYDATRRLTLSQLGISQETATKRGAISNIGVSDPFPLFTQEAIDIMRNEVLQRETFLKYARYSFNSTSGMDCCIRGYVKTTNKDGANSGTTTDANVELDMINCPFIYEAWTHPETMRLISQMAGVELEVVMDYEIAHVNVSLKSEAEAEEERMAHSLSKKCEQEEEKEEEEDVANPVDIHRKQTGARSMSETNGDDIKAVVGWHYDSYPFVCVLMLSDTTEMIGGETCLRMGHENTSTSPLSSDAENSSFGKVAIIPGPKLGSASVLQGRLIQHIAPQPRGLSERITMVTSYRARNPELQDTSILSTVKPEVNFGSRYNDFYPEWVRYRCDLMCEKLNLAKEKCVTKDGKFDKAEAKKRLQEVEMYLRKTYEEMEVTDAEAYKMMRKASVF